MKCIRCGYCCQNSWVVIVDDPAKGPVEGNFKVVGQNGSERCQHLRGDKPGKFSCAIHTKKWYKKTPCFAHGQIEQSKNDVCRMGKYLLKLGRL